MDIGTFTFAELHADPRTGKTLSAQQRLRDVIELGKLADQAGLSVFGIGEHHRSDFAAASPPVVLAAIAGQTDRIRLTSSVTVLSSADPVAVFEQFTALDLASDGRAEIIVGRGAFAESFPLFGYELSDYEQLFAEKLDLLLQLREHERVTWSGRFRPALRDQPVFPRPVQPTLPVSVGVGGTPGSAARAGTLGLPLVIGIIGGQPRRFAALADIYREAARVARHTSARQSVSVSSHTYVAETSQAADAFYPHYAGYMHDVSGGRFLVTPADFEAGRRLEGALFVGSPSQIVEKLLYQHELFGHRQFLAQISVGSLPHAMAMRAVELLGTEVLPQVRRALKSEEVEAATADVP